MWLHVCYASCMMPAGKIKPRGKHISNEYILEEYSWCPDQDDPQFLDSLADFLNHLLGDVVKNHHQAYPCSFDVL